MQSVNKQQISVQLTLSTINKIESLKKLDDGKTSRNKIIESAVDFYFGYKTSEITQDYLCSIVGQKIEGMINNASNRTSKLQFKEAVEINVLTRIVASMMELDKDSYDKMRRKAVEDVKARYAMPVVAIADLSDLMSFLKETKDPELSAYQEAISEYRRKYGSK